jgi:hypothetical protein
MIKTFRGLLADGGQETIRLATNKGQIGYKIKKFEIMANTPGAQTAEYIAKIWTREQTTVDGVIDFSNSQLLAAATLVVHTSSSNPETPTAVILDNVPINQDIFVTAFDQDSSSSMNYYIELEQLQLNENEATVATLKDMRGSN